MGTYTFANFKDYIKLRFGNSDAYESPTDYYGKWANSAYKFIAHGYRLPWIKKNLYHPELETNATKNTSDGVAYVSEPTDCLIVRDLYNNTSDAWMQWIPWTTYIKTSGRADTDNEGEPTEWTKSGGNIFLRDTPDGIYELDVFYKKKVTALSASGHVTLISADWDEPIVCLGSYFGYQATAQYDKAKANLDEFLALASVIISNQSSEGWHRGRYPKITDGTARERYG